MKISNFKKQVTKVPPFEEYFDYRELARSSDEASEEDPVPKSLSNSLNIIKAF